MGPTDVVSGVLQAEGKSSHSVPGVIGFVTIPGGVELRMGAVPEKVAPGDQRSAARRARRDGDEGIGGKDAFFGDAIEGGS